MSIDNLYVKCSTKDMFLKKLENGEVPKNFNDMQTSGEFALSQLNSIYQCIKNFKRLKKALDDIPKFKEEKKKRLENNEIV